MQKWGEINQLRHAIKHGQYKYGATSLTFQGTIKIHGSNLGVTRHRGVFTTQSRSTILSNESDNFGFNSWFTNILSDTVNQQQIDTMFDSISNNPEDIVTIYGEYAGIGIQKNVAISQLERSWYIFGAKVNGDSVPISQQLRVENCTLIRNILDYVTFCVVIDLVNPNESVETLNNLTLSVENQCPVAAKHGVHGIGEGIVWRCLDYPLDSDLVFKTKGEKHSGKEKTERVVSSVDPVVLQQINDVVNYILPDGRLHQGLEHVDQVEMECLGQYLKWINTDVLKEEQDTLEANHLTWKQVQRSITDKARMFFIAQIKSIV